MRMAAARAVLAVSVVLSGAARVWSEGVTIEIRSTWWGMRAKRTETYTIAQQGGKYYLEGMATVDDMAGQPREETYKVGPIDEKEITDLLQALNEPIRSTVQLEDFLSLMVGQPTQEEFSKQAPQLVDRLTARPRWVSGDAQYQAWTEAQKSLLLNKLRDGHAVAEVLKTYFYRGDVTDDYPTVSVTITQPDQTTIRFESDHSSAFMLPWKVIRGEQAAETFNPRISRAVADLLPGGASERMRLRGRVLGHDYFNEDKVTDEVAHSLYKELEQLDREPQP